MIRVVAANGANRAARRPFPLRQTLHPMKTRFLSAALAAMLIPTVAWSATEIIDGIEWTYSVSNGKATLNRVPASVSGKLVTPTRIGNCPVVAIGPNCFASRPNLTSITVSEGVSVIGNDAFIYCTRLGKVSLPDTLVEIQKSAFQECMDLDIDIPESVRTMGYNVFYKSSGVIRFWCDVPSWVTSYWDNSYLASSSLSIYATEAFSNNWKRYLSTVGASVIGFARKPSCSIEVLSESMRENDPTIMDVVYKVVSSNATVNVRALAFKDGDLSFTKIVRPETFVDGTDANIGDGVPANVEHTVSWRVSADWPVELAKVSLAFFVSDQGLLPLELVTIPPANNHSEMTINVQRPISRDVFNALLWHYANRTDDLTLVDGVLKCGSTTLASGASLANSAAAVSYVYGKMGFDLLAGENLSYARMATRLPTQLQYAVKRESGE